MKNLTVIIAVLVSVFLAVITYQQTQMHEREIEMYRIYASISELSLEEYENDIISFEKLTQRRNKRKELIDQLKELVDSLNDKKIPQNIKDFLKQAKIEDSLPS